MTLVYGSVCSGIEAASVAWEPLGWQPAWFAEIDRFASAVLKYRYPRVPNLGDFTKIGREHGPIDVLVGGTPCQSFSVAGERGGLADPRGNLAIEFVGLAGRLRPRWVIWENVPGVLSSGGGRDFSAFVTALAECGYGWAYAVLDAQNFGVPQRRRRVFLVGHSGGKWQRAASVLFDRHSLQGNPKKSRAARQDVAGTLGSRTTGGGGYDPTDYERNGGYDVTAAPDVAYAVNGSSQRLDGPVETLVAFDLNSITSSENHSQPQPGDPYHTLASTHHPPVLAFYGQGGTRDISASEGTSPALKVGGPHGGGQVVVAFDWQSGGDQRLHISAEHTSALQANQTPAIVYGDKTTVVRRITPREAERLQGFPDDWTLVPYGANHAKDFGEWLAYLRGRLTGLTETEARRLATDSPRYRAIGNSMAVPVVRWIGERIAQVDAIPAATA